MGFFGDLKADITQAVDELTDGTEETAKKDNKKTFGKKGKKSSPAKAAAPVESTVEELYQAVDNKEDDRSDTEKALWDELRSDYSASDAGHNSSYSQAVTEDVITPDDVVEELVEIEENEIVDVKEVPMANVNISQNAKKRETKEYILPEGAVSDELGVITAGMAVLGNIYSTGHMEIYGSVEGDVEISGSLRVLGNIIGNVKANEVILENGKIKGNVSCATGISIANGCVVIGDIISGTGAGIGGAVKGDIDVHGPVTLESTAIVKGNIKSQSVQMANGAMVDGMCSQCYSEVDLSSFFDNV